MDEIMLVARAFTALICTAIASGFWALGGRSMEELAKWHLDFIKNRVWGRIIAPVWFGLCVNGLALWAGNWSWPILLFVPAMIGVSTMGHGGDTLWMKIFRRTLNAVVWSLPAVILCIACGAWALLILQFVVAVSGSLIWGVTNPKLAPTEEFYLNLCKIVVMPAIVLT